MAAQSAVVLNLRGNDSLVWGRLRRFGGSSDHEADLERALEPEADRSSSGLNWGQHNPDTDAHEPGVREAKVAVVAARCPAVLSAVCGPSKSYRSTSFVGLPHPERGRRNEHQVRGSCEHLSSVEPLARGWRRPASQMPATRSGMRLFITPVPPGKPTTGDKVSARSAPITGPGAGETVSGCLAQGWSLHSGHHWFATTGQELVPRDHPRWRRFRGRTSLA